MSDADTLFKLVRPSNLLAQERESRKREQDVALKVVGIAIRALDDLAGPAEISRDSCRVIAKDALERMELLVS